MRSGRSPGDPHIVGSNFAELDLELSTAGMENREETLAALRQELDRVPGVAVNVGGFISHRMDEVLSGVRSAIAVKIFWSRFGGVTSPGNGGAIADGLD